MNKVTQTIVSIVLIAISFSANSSAKPIKNKTVVNKIHYNGFVFKTKLQMPKIKELKIKTKRRGPPNTQFPWVNFGGFHAFVKPHESIKVGCPRSGKSCPKRKC